jgi:xylulokinase
VTHYLGIDVGTFESKGVLVDAKGRIVAQAARPHKMLVPQPGWAEHRPREDWWGDFCFISNKLLAEGGVPANDIRAVATSAIGPCMLPVDVHAEPLMNGVLYGVDTRSAREIEELTAQIGEARLIEECGNALTSQSVGPKVLWLRRNRPEIWARTKKVVTSATYIVERLTGRHVIDHYSAGSFSPMYIPAQQAWSTALGNILPTDMLPELLWTTDVAGHVTARAAEETGLAVGTPVTAGTIDAGAEALSVGVLDPGDMLLMYGSTVFIIEITAERVRDPRLWYAPWLFPGQHAAMSGLATSGTLSHWFRENFAKELDPETAVVTLAAEAEQSPPGAKGLVLLPYFSGERTPIHDPQARGMIFGLDLTHTRGDVYRAVFEGIACGTRHVFETYAEAGQEPKAILAAGGGTRNRVWSQATSDISGRPQIVREITVGASYGDAFIAALAVGDVRREDIRTWNAVAREIVPDPANAATYERTYRTFRELYPRTRSLLPQSIP